MSLSLEELQFIDTYLQNSDIEYIDVRLELTDHIATAVEEELKQNNTLGFYDVFKNYMIHHKQHLLDNYSIQQRKVRDEIRKQFLKNFLGIEALLLIIVFILMAIKVDVFSFKSHFIKVNFGFFLTVLIYYYIAFHRTKRTSVGKGILSVITLCFYGIHYVRNPLNMLFLIPTVMLGYEFFKFFEKRISKIWSVSITVLFAVAMFPVFHWFDKWSTHFVTDDILVGYFFFQLLIWAVLFKTLHNYKVALNKKFKSVFS